MACSERVSNDVAQRRAGGRRRYNAQRRAQCGARRRLVLRVLLQHGRPEGLQTALAAQLGVSRATICRDVRVLWPIVERAAPGAKILISLRTYRVL